MKTHLAAVQERYARMSGNGPADDHELEAHVRKYFIDGLLWALNWRLDAGPPNPTALVLVEAQLAPEGQDGAVRFLDYLGVERETLRALLVLEAKRPSVELPTRLEGRRVAPVRALAAGLAGKDLGAGWTQRPPARRDYARRGKAYATSAPRRLVATDRQWLAGFPGPP